MDRSAKGRLFVAAQCMAMVLALPEGMDWVLEESNIYRCMHGVPALTWSDDVASSAQAWATSGTCDTLNHDPNWQGGENIYWASPAPAPSDWYKGVDNWYSEIKETQGGLVPSYNPAAGHYTQLVWKASMELGCGTCEGTLVCRYTPAGNVMGEFPSNVFAPTKSWSECGGWVSLRWAGLATAHLTGSANTVMMPVGMDSVLEESNIYRCMHGVPALTWSDDVASSAQAWATSGTCDTLNHDPNWQGGENIYWASPAPAPSDWYKGVDDWYSEIKETQGGLVPSYNPAAGHYTQLVWKASAELGCGTCGGTLVCRYTPAGNVMGEFPSNVFAPIKSRSECGGQRAQHKIVVI